MLTIATKTLPTGANGQKADGTSIFVRAVLKKLSCAGEKPLKLFGYCSSNIMITSVIAYIEEIFVYSKCLESGLVVSRQRALGPDCGHAGRCSITVRESRVTVHFTQLCKAEPD